MDAGQLLLLAWVAAVGWATVTDLHIAGFFPTTLNLSEGAIGRGVIPAVELALADINSNPDILTDYKLDIYWNNTECDAAKGMKAFFDMLSKKPPKLMLFGAACTPVTDPIAKASRFFQLVQLTYADTHPMYNTENYPNFYRVVPSEASFNPARVALLQHFNWSRVGTLYQSSPRYALPHSRLLTEMDEAKIKIAASHGLDDTIQDELQKMKHNDVRIIVGNFDEAFARKIFCEAYHQQMYGRKYQWVILGLYQERWWEQDQDGVPCNQEQLLQALEGYIATDVLPLSTSSDTTIAGMTSQDYEKEYNKVRKGEYSRFHGYAYDGIWALALAVQTVIKKLKTLGISWSLEDFRYRDPFWGKLFRDALNETTFVGVTGVVKFVQNERRGQILLKQFQNGAEVKVGEYDCSESDLDLSKGTAIKFRGSGPPMDRTLTVHERTRVSVTVYSILVISASIGIILAIVFLGINIRYRNQRYIKMSSPYLNNMIIMGCILTYTSVILLGLDSGLTSVRNFPYICAARAWVLMSGFTLAFGSMFSKTWRVHAIFTNIKLNKKVIKDYKLFLVVGILVMIDVIILTTWQIVDPFYRETKKGTPIPSSENEDIEIIPVMEFCQSKKMTIFLSTIYAYKGLLMAFGCFLAWETRHVSIPALNDSKYIGMSVYNVVIMCTIGAGVSFVLRDQQDAAFIIISVFIIFCSSTTICLVFVPKVRLLVELKRNPHAGDKRVRATLKPLKKSRRDSEDSVTMHSRIKYLLDENHRHRQRLEERTIEVHALMMKLKELEEPLILISHDPITPIPEITSPTPENSTEKEDTSDDKAEVELIIENNRIRKLSAVSLRVPPPLPPPPQRSKKRVTIRTESSCPDLSSPPEVPPLETRCLSFLDQVSMVARFADASSSSSSSPDSGGESDSSQKSFLKEYYQPLESDDTSYARAISGQRSTAVNGMSSSCDEDTDRGDAALFSEAESDTSKRGAHRRAKSLGALLSPTSPTDGGVSVIEGREHPSLLPPLFPFFTRIVAENHGTGLRDGHMIYSSFPSIKCDIVEYL